MAYYNGLTEFLPDVLPHPPILLREVGIQNIDKAIFGLTLEFFNAIKCYSVALFLKNSYITSYYFFDCKVVDVDII